MTGIVVAVVSFAVAVLGFADSHAAPEGQKGVLGLSPLGATLILLSIIGVAAGVISQLFASKAANEDKKWREDTTALLRNVYAQLRGVQDKDRPTDPALAKQLGFITDQISAAATQSRGSDFSLSDFTASDFRNGSFVNTNFDNALFAGAVFRRAQFSRADLSDADLSGAIINSGTRLPTKR